MRIWISNTVEEQPWQSTINPDSFDFSTSNDASYRVKIEGRLLDDEDDDDDSEDAAQKGDKDAMETDAPSKQKPAAAVKGQRARFSHFFKAIHVTVERPGAPVGPAGPEQLMEWKKPERAQGAGATAHPAADFDEITFKRGGDDNINVMVSLTRHEDPERFAISPALAEVVDLTEGSRLEVTARLWDYIRLMGLQEDEEKRQFRCDGPLKEVHRNNFLSLAIWKAKWLTLSNSPS
jgi:SWI/SNF-related matrix-associated actin-dependent regulator of chromatin subfamily D